MPVRSAPQPVQPYLGERSRLAEMLARKRDKPIYSVGQGLAEALGDVGEAYFLRKADEKDKAEAAEKNRALAEAFGTSMLSGNTQDGPPMSPQMAAQNAYRQLMEKNPEAAVQNVGNLTSLAEMFAPPKPQMFTGTLKPGEEAWIGGNKVASLPEKSSLLSPEEEAQKIRIAAAGRTPAQPKSLVDMFKDRFGDLPKDMTPVVGANGLPTGQVAPLTGGPADPAVIETERVKKLEAERPNADKYTLKSVQTIDNMLENVNALLKSKDLGDVTGSLEGRGLTLNQVFSDDNATAASQLENLRSATQIQGLQDLRDASKTGGGVGSATEGEWPKLGSRVANLDPVQGTPEVRRQLRALRRDLRQSRAAVTGAYEEAYKGLPKGVAQLPEPDYSKLPPGSQLLDDGTVKLANGQIVEWEDE
jgi:hypothetical protein